MIYAHRCEESKNSRALLFKYRIRFEYRIFEWEIFKNDIWEI